MNTERRHRAQELRAKYGRLAKPSVQGVSSPRARSLLGHRVSFGPRVCLRTLASVTVPHHDPPAHPPRPCRPTVSAVGHLRLVGHLLCGLEVALLRGEAGEGWGRVRVRVRVRARVREVVRVRVQRPRGHLSGSRSGSGSGQVGAGVGGQGQGQGSVRSGFVQLGVGPRWRGHLVREEAAASTHRGAGALIGLSSC